MKQYPVHYFNLKQGDTLAYRQAGNGPQTLIMLHGNMSSSVNFTRVMNALEETLGNELTIYAIDMRGFGDSTYFKPTHSLRDLGWDIIEFIQYYERQQISILGWSTGGGVAAEIAADIPHSIEKLYLVSSVGLQGYDVGSILSPLPSLYSGWMQRYFSPWNVGLQQIESAIQRRDRVFLSDILSSIYSTRTISREEFNIYLESMFQQQNFSDIYFNLIEFNMTNQSNGVRQGTGRAQLIQAPLVIIHGRDDVVVDKKHARETKAYFGDQAQLHLLNGGHAIMSDCFNEFVLLLEEELRQSN